MDLPKLPPGKRFTVPRPTGSADALLLARLGEREKSAQRTTVIVTADASDAQRLIDEMTFFAPELRCAGVVKARAKAKFMRRRALSDASA